MSKDDGSQDTENQLHDCLEMAKQRGWEVLPEFIFREEVSGKTLRADRPVFDRMANLASKGKFGVLVVWKLDRFSRDGSYQGGLMMLGEFCEQFNVPVVSYNETYLDCTGPFRVPLTAIALKLAEEVRSAIVDHTRKAIDKRKREIDKQGRFLVTGEKSKRRGQWVARLGRPSLPDDDLRRAREAWSCGLSAFRAAKKLSLPESTLRGYWRKWSGFNSHVREKGWQAGGEKVAENQGDR